MLHFAFLLPTKAELGFLPEWDQHSYSSSIDVNTKDHQGSTPLHSKEIFQVEIEIEDEAMKL